MSFNSFSGGSLVYASGWIILVVFANTHMGPIVILTCVSTCTSFLF